jgi:hypothetical protein
MGVDAFYDAAYPPCEHTVSRLIPWASSEASGSSAPLRDSLKELVQIKHGITPPHVIDRTRHFMGEDGQGFTLAMFFL